MRGTNTWTTVFDGFVGARELGEVVPCHFRFDFDGVEGLAIVYTDDATDHLRDDDHVSQVSLYDGWFLVRRGLFFGFAEFLDETHWTAFEAAVELATSTCVDEFNELFIA